MYCRILGIILFCLERCCYCVKLTETNSCFLQLAEQSRLLDKMADINDLFNDPNLLDFRVEQGGDWRNHQIIPEFDVIDDGEWRHQPADLGVFVEFLVSQFRTTLTRIFCCFV